MEKDPSTAPRHQTDVKNEKYNRTTPNKQKTTQTAPELNLNLPAANNNKNKPKTRC
jgi:hypothetical protein